MIREILHGFSRRGIQGLHSQADDKAREILAWYSRETENIVSSSAVTFSRNFRINSLFERFSMQLQQTDVELSVAHEQDQLAQSVKVGGIYQHYRGDRYKVIAVSRHSEDLSWYVVYEALYDNPVSKIWHRPLAMFLEETDVNGVRMPRFKLVD